MNNIQIFLQSIRFWEKFYTSKNWGFEPILMNENSLHIFIKNGASDFFKSL